MDGNFVSVKNGGMQGELMGSVSYACGVATRSHVSKTRMTPAPVQPDDSTYAGRFAARLRELRQKSGKSVADVTSELELHGLRVSARALYSWESAEAQPSINAIQALANVYRLKTPRLLLPEK